MSDDNYFDLSFERLRRLSTFSQLLHAEMQLFSKQESFGDVKVADLDQLVTKIKGVQEKLEQTIYIVRIIESWIRYEQDVPPYIARQMRRSLDRVSRIRSGPVNRIVPTPVDEVDSGYINEDLPADHPFFKSVPLTYVHGGPAASCMYCKETFPCGCKTPPPTPPPMSPPPVRMKAKRRPDSPITAADIYADIYGLRDAQEIPEESYSLSDSQKALLEDSVMQK